MMFYKESEFQESPIGKIPKDWDIVELGTYIDIYSGYAFKSKDFLGDESDGVPIVKIGNLQNGLTVINEKTNYVQRNLYEKLPDFQLHKGDVLIALSGATTGKIAVVNRDFGMMLVNQRVGKFRILKTDKIYQSFFYQLAQSDVFKRFVLRRIGRSAQGNLSPLQLKKTPIFIPPLPEQREIANALSMVGEAIQKTDEVIAKTERLKKGLMQTLLTRGIGHIEFKETRIGRIPKEWDIAKLGEIATIRYGLGQPPESDENGTPMIRATNIKRGVIVETDVLRVKRSTIPESRNPFLREGDVIVVRSGAYTGDIGHITKRWEGAIAGYDLVVSPSNRINSVYLAHYLLSLRVQTYFSQLKSRSAQPHLNSEQVSDTPIALPSLSEQRNIADFLSTIDKKLGLERNEKVRLERVKRGLMDLLLTGKVRVKVN